MITIRIYRWSNPIEGSAWGIHTAARLKQQMRSGISLPPTELKALTRSIRAREPVLLRNVREVALNNLVRSLRSMGAEMTVEMGDNNYPELFKKLPKR